MRDAVLAELELAATDLFIGAAAVADWRPQPAAEGKLKKTAGGEPPVPRLLLNPDILAEVAALPHGPYCVGFAAEAEQLLANAQAKRERKGVELLVANLGPQTFGRDDNACLLIDSTGAREFPRMSKLELARRLIEEIAARLAARG
jgi:phosphopantothenoylcysteine decarboxylase/phosphopantothenate--cysteine ligase